MMKRKCIYFCMILVCILCLCSCDFGHDEGHFREQYQDLQKQSSMIQQEKEHLQEQNAYLKVIVLSCSMVALIVGIIMGTKSKKESRMQEERRTTTCEEEQRE